MAQNRLPSLIARVQPAPPDPAIIVASKPIEYGSNRILNIRTGFNDLCSWGAADGKPRLVVVDCVTDKNVLDGNADRPMFMVSWAVGSFSFPPAFFNSCARFVIPASSVHVSIRNTVSPTDYNASAAVGPFEGSLSPTDEHPTWVNDANRIRAIGAGGNANFALSPYTRRVMVIRQSAANAFTVQNGFGVLAAIAANAFMEMMEVPGPVINVTSTAADSFTIIEELDL